MTGSPPRFMQCGIGSVCRLTLGTALLYQLAVAVRAVQDRLRLEPDKGARARGLNLGLKSGQRCHSARCFTTGSPPLSMQCGTGPLRRLTFGTAVLDQLAVAVRAVQDRLRLEPDKEEARARGLNLGLK